MHATESFDSGTCIPLINLDNPTASEDILSAASKYGFVFVEHQDLTLTHEHVNRMFYLSKKFFEQSSPDAKQRFAINSSSTSKNRGWVGSGTESLDPQQRMKGSDSKEAFNIGEFVNGRAQQTLPEPLASNEQDVGNFFHNCHSLCKTILQLFARALEIDPSAGGEDWFSVRHDSNAGPSGSVLRLLHYPSSFSSSTSSDNNSIRAGAHSDYGSITLLFRLPDQAGLEILTPEGTWIPVPVDPRPATTSNVLPILVNIGDLLSYWTNGMLKSTVHRVTFAKEGGGCEADRYSIAYFCHPQDDAVLTEIPSAKIKALAQSANCFGPTHDSAMTARDHLNNRLAATYELV